MPGCALPRGRQRFFGRARFAARAAEGRPDGGTEERGECVESAGIQNGGGPDHSEGGRSGQDRRRMRAGAFKGGEAVRRSVRLCGSGKEASYEEDTIFRLFSLTKPITSAAVMLLAERGLLELSDPVSRYLPQFAGMQYGRGREDWKRRPGRSPSGI